MVVYALPEDTFYCSRPLIVPPAPLPSSSKGAGAVANASNSFATCSSIEKLPRLVVLLIELRVELFLSGSAGAGGHCRPLIDVDTFSADLEKDVKEFGLVGKDGLPLNAAALVAPFPFGFLVDFRDMSTTA